MPDRRRAGLVVLVVLVAISFLLSVDPLELGAVRLAGVALSWWYALAIAPAIAVGASSLALRGAMPWSEISRIAAWAGPMLVAALAFRVLTGAADGALLVVVALAAPLVAWLSARDLLPSTPELVALALP